MPVRKLVGRAWLFGDLIDVDWEIIPYDLYGRLRGQGIPIVAEELGKYCMTVIDPDFPRKVSQGDFIVAGENFGYGHDHEWPPLAIKGAGVAAVLCESTNGNFFRNSVEQGLPVVECPGIKGVVKEGDKLEVELAKGTVRNISRGAQLSFAPYPPFLLEMLDSGGLYPHLKEQIKKGGLSA